MDSDIIADLKQFIAATISQQFTGFATKDDLANLATKDDIAELKADLQALDQKVDNIQAAIGDALDNSNDAYENQLTDHEQRLTTLEHKTA